MFPSILLTALLCTAAAAKEGPRIDIGALSHHEQASLVVAIGGNLLDKRSVRLNITSIPLPANDPFKSSRIICDFVATSPHLAAIIATASPVAQMITKRLQLPFLQTHWQEANSFIGGESALNLHPDFKQLSLGLAQIVKSLEWSSFFVLYETDEGLLRIQEILKLQKHNPHDHRNTIHVRKFNFNADFRSVLKEIKSIGETRIILDCETGHIMEIFEQAKSVHLMGFIHKYFLTSLDAHTLDFDSLDTEANITTVRIFNPPGDDFDAVIKTWADSPYIFDKLTELAPYNLLTETILTYEAVSLLSNALNDIELDDGITFANLSCRESHKFNHGLDIISYIKSESLKKPLLTGPMVFDSSGRRTGFSLFVIDGNREKTIAIWDSLAPDNINIIRNEEERYHERIQSLQKGVKIIASRYARPYLMRSETGELEGYAMDLMKEIAGILKFEFEFQMVADGNQGNYDETTNSWNGIIGEIVSERALFGIGDVTITPRRERFVDFSMPYMRLGIGILFRKPETQKNMFAFLNPLSIEVWMYTATLYLTVSIILYFVARMAPGDWENPHPCNQRPSELENIWDLKNCLWLTLASIMNQGSDILPKGISSRLVASMWYFFALIMTNSYIASLAAFLTDKKSIIDDLEDLAKQNKIKYGTLKGGSTEEFFMQSNYSTYRRMYANMILSEPSVFVDNQDDGINRVKATKDGTYAFLMESTTIDYLVERNCELATVSGQWFNNKEYGIAMPLDCPYRTAINDAILLLQEKGKLNELRTRWWLEKYRGSKCESTPTSSELRIENVGGIFIVLGIGIAIALLLGIMEFLWTVRQVSVEEHISYWTAFKSELMFALKVWISKKKLKTASQESLSGNHSSSVDSMFNLNAKPQHLSNLSEHVE